MIPLSVPHLKGNESKYVMECLESNWISSAGEFVNRFEKGIADFVGSSFGIACSSGTAALHVSLLLAGVQPEDEVLVPTVTFIAPVNAIHYVGAFPVFMDCDAHLNLDVEKVNQFLKEECRQENGVLRNKTSGRRVKAIVPVHIFGHPVSMEPLMELSRCFDLEIIEDATESLGSFYTQGLYQGKKTGTIGKFGCYSFNGNKIISTGGGGMIVTEDEPLARKAKYLTTQAKDDSFRFVHNEIGYNYRLTNIQAAIGLAQLECLREFIVIKRSNFEKYREAIDGYKGLRWITEPAGTHSNYWHYSLLLKKDDALEVSKKLSTLGVETRPLWMLNHLQKPYLQHQNYDIQRALDYSRCIVNVPCSIGLTSAEIDKTVEMIRSVI